MSIHSGLGRPESGSEATTDTTVLSGFSETQLLEALRQKQRAKRDELKMKILDLRDQLSRAESELAKLAGQDAEALALIRGGPTPKVEPGRRGRSGTLGLAILAELKTGAKSPRDLVEACGDHINSERNKATIVAQKLTALKKQGKVTNPSKGVWELAEVKPG
jgi:hypothetical protein